jgi:hypothetical protein
MIQACNPERARIAVELHEDGKKNGVPAWARRFAIFAKLSIKPPSC